MADVLLSDFLAHLFGQISAARQMADRHSKEIALLYAGDDVLRHFSVPRFKLAKLDLTIPVLVSGVQLSTLVQFRMSRDDFGKLILGKVLGLVALLRRLKPGTKSQPSPHAEGIDSLIDDFHRQLSALPDPSRPEAVIEGTWPEIVARVLETNGIPGELARTKPASELFSGALRELTEVIKAKTTVTTATLDKLLINPETHVVKDGSNGASVFTIKAELIEEGVIVRRVKDARTGVESAVVEFE
jgi:hypothetical protein